MKTFWYVFVKTEHSVWSDGEKNIISNISNEDNSVFNNAEYKFYTKNGLQEYIVELLEIIKNIKNISNEEMVDIYEAVSVLGKLLKEIPSNKGVIVNYS